MLHENNRHTTTHNVQEGANGSNVVRHASCTHCGTPNVQSTQCSFHTTYGQQSLLLNGSRRVNRSYRVVLSTLPGLLKSLSDHIVYHYFGTQHFRGLQNRWKTMHCCIVRKPMCVLFVCFCANKDGFILAGTALPLLPQTRF